MSNIFIYIHIEYNQANSPVVECLPMVWEIWVQSQVESYQRLKKMVLDATLLNTQDYNVWIKGKVEQSRERSSTLPYTLVS